MARRHAYEPSLLDGLNDSKADYQSSKRTGRFQRRRRGVPVGGASGDWHYRNETDFFYAGEAARDMYRNDAVMGQLVDRAVENTIGSGFKPNPNTGDKKLDKDLKDRWVDEALEPDLCDLAGEMAFLDQQQTALREMFIVGECFPTAIDNGTVDMREFHRVRSPSRKAQRLNNNIVHGISLDPSTRRRLQYWFTKEPVDPLSSQAIRKKDLFPVAARDDEGELNVWHVYKPKRPTQTRGVTAFNPIFHVAGMADDLFYLTVLKAQMAALFLINEKASPEFDPTQSPAKIGRETVDEVLRNLRPGSVLPAERGVSRDIWSAQVPNPEYFPHMRLLLQLLGINLGMPLVLLLMDASETNFSGYRGAVDQARQGFRANQNVLAARFHRPYWRMKLNHWADNDPYLATRRDELGAKFFKHFWATARWKYIEPTKDATSDLLRDAHMLTSPRRRCNEQNEDWDEIVEETVTDRALAIGRALEEAKKLNELHALKGDAAVAWRDLAPLSVPERVNVTINGNDAPGTEQENDNDQNRPPTERRAA